jgi:hypothetical protein
MHRWQRSSSRAKEPPRRRHAPQPGNRRTGRPPRRTGPGREAGTPSRAHPHRRPRKLTEPRSSWRRAKSLLENSGGSGEAAGHDDDHGPVDVGLMVGGQAIVVADGAPVSDDPPRRRSRGGCGRSSPSLHRLRVNHCRGGPRLPPGGQPNPPAQVIVHLLIGAVCLPIIRPPVKGCPPAGSPPAAPAHGLGEPLRRPARRDRPAAGPYRARL